MPKRRCCFDDWSPLPQFKIHVSQKEVDFGVNSDMRMKNVYEITRMKLFSEGRKQQFPPRNSNTSSLDSSRLVADSCKPADCPGCFSRKPILQSRCNFCEKFYCASCVYLCKKCDGEYCSLCSMRQYSCRDDSALCFNCIK